MSKSKAPLAGITVVELGTNAAVPTVTRIMADWGAEVIKIENLKGDEWRVSGKNLVTPVTIDENPIFTMQNANKKMIALNMKDPDGMDAFKKLIAKADVFITNIRMHSLAKMGVDYEALKTINPMLIYCSFNGYGPKGPEASKAGFDKSAFWAKSGILMDSAFVEGPPANPITAFGDFTVASMFTSGVLAALLGRDKNGEGTFVDCSLYGCGIWYAQTGVIASQECYANELNAYPKSCNRPLVPLSHFYKCKDGEWIMISSVDHGKYYPRFCKLLGLEEYLDDERFNTIDNIKKNVAEFSPIAQAQFMTKTSDEWLKILEEGDFPCQRLTHLKDVTRDPQAWETEYLVNVTFPSGNTAVLPTLPVKFSNYKVEEYIPTGEIGRDTADVLTGIGYTEEQVKAYREKGAVK